MFRDTWHECYEQQLTDVIVPEAFAHPAKMSWRLAQRIMTHLAEWCPGDARDRVIVDPMAGIGTVGLAAAYAGYPAILGELEAHFASLCRQNIAMHAARLQALDKPIPMIVRHDARQLPLYDAAAIVSSPPYAATIQHAQNGIDHTKYQRAHDRRATRNRRAENSKYGDLSYGVHPDQIGNLRAVVSSPPYGAIRQDGGGQQENYGGLRSYSEGSTDQWHTQRDQTNIGNLGNSYWTAIQRVYLECARIMPPAAPMILVLKGYVKDKEYVDLPMQTAQLLDACGFIIRHWHTASLVSREAQLDLFGGETRRARKSFFRRLAENNGAPPIDYEVVLCAERKE